MFLLWFLNHINCVELSMVDSQNSLRVVLENKDNYLSPCLQSWYCLRFFPVNVMIFAVICLTAEWMRLQLLLVLIAVKFQSISNMMWTFTVSSPRYEQLSQWLVHVTSKFLLLIKGKHTHAGDTESDRWANSEQHIIMFKLHRHRNMHMHKVIINLRVKPAFHQAENPSRKMFLSSQARFRLKVECMERLNCHKW